MTAYAGSSPERPRDLTRPDLRLPRTPGASPAPPPLQPPVPPTAAPAPAPSPAAGRNWHRFHFAIGVFLVAYGVTGFATALIGWDERRQELAGYIGAGQATPALAAVKMVELVLVALALAGLVRRRDLWFLPSLAGWLLGFAAFAVLDVVKGKWGGLLEHSIYLAGFALLLFLSYGLSVKARVGSRAGTGAPQPVPDPGGAPAPAQAPDPMRAQAPAQAQAPGPDRPLTRTQEFALAAINRAHDVARSATGGNVLPGGRRPEPSGGRPSAQAADPPPPQAPARPDPAPAAPSAGTEVTRAERLPTPPAPRQTPDAEAGAQGEIETADDMKPPEDSKLTQAFRAPEEPTVVDGSGEEAVAEDTAAGKGGASGRGTVVEDATRPLELPDE